MNVTLKVGGALHTGWTQIDIQRSIETIAGGFCLVMTALDPARGRIVKVSPGQPCELSLGGETIITGFVDDSDVEFDAERHEITVAGRDRTGDMVDCAAYVPGIHAGNWAAGVTGLKIVSDIAQPFGIGVKQEIDAGVASYFALQPEETAFAAIDRLAKEAGFLPVSDGLGNLLLTSGGMGGSFAPLVEGRNILAAQGHVSHRDRFSRYYVMSDGAGYIADAPPGTMAHADDPAITRWRPTVIVASEGLVAGESLASHLQVRATWEATVHAGRALRHLIVTQGWQDDQGRLWRPNGLVRVTSAMLGVDETLLIVSVRFVLDREGSRTELGVTRPDAFKLIPLATLQDYIVPGARPGAPQ